MLAAGLEPGVHLGDLRFLRLDHRFRKFADFGILAVLKLDLGHIDRALMVRDHSANEVHVGIAAILDHHILVHPVVRLAESVAGSIVAAHRLAHVHGHVFGKGRGGNDGEHCGKRDDFQRHESSFLCLTINTSAVEAA
ncbi:hypothetical protein ATY76_21195 [Rhizobium sp. R339]|nr:hypothetical protein ATY76_21195 [Rhizobium sp. R339]